MAFTVQDFEDLLRLLDERPEWLEALRQRVFTSELAEVPRLMREIAESQARTQQVLEAFGRRLDQREQQIDELAQLMKQLALRVDEIARQLEQLTRRVDALGERVDQLAQRIDQLTQRVNEIAEQLAQLTRRVDALGERVDQLTQRVDEIAEQLAQLTRRVDALAERVDQLTQRVDEIAEQLAQLTRRVDALAERVDQLTQRVDEIAEQLAQLTRRVDALAERVDQLTAQMSEMARQFARYRKDTDQLKGMMLEMRYAQRPYAYFKDLIRRARTLTVDELYDLLESVGLTEAEMRDVLECDALISGRSAEDGKPTYLLLEASWTVDLEDVERASRRAALLSRAGVSIIPVVAGYAARPNALEEAKRQNVRCVFDDRIRESDERA